MTSPLHLDKTSYMSRVANSVFHLDLRAHCASQHYSVDPGRVVAAATPCGAGCGVGVGVGWRTGDELGARDYGTPRIAARPRRHRFRERSGKQISRNAGTEIRRDSTPQLHREPCSAARCRCWTPVHVVHLGFAAID